MGAGAAREWRQLSPRGKAGFSTELGKGGEMSVEAVRILRIWQDTRAEDPRTRDNLGTMVCWHRKYRLGDRHKFRTPEEFLAWVEEAGRENFVILPLYLCDHGGLSMQTVPFGDPWDSGQVGWIYAGKPEVCSAFGVPELTEEVAARAEEVLRAEVDDYDRWLRGDVYGFSVFALQNGRLSLEDSCGGFYGDGVDSGILDCVPEDFRPLLREAGRICGGQVFVLWGGEGFEFDSPREFLEFAKADPALREFGELYACLRGILAA